MIVVAMAVAWGGYTIGLWGITFLKTAGGAAVPSIGTMIVPSKWNAAGGWPGISANFGDCSAVGGKPAVNVPGLPKVTPQGVDHIPGTNIPLPPGL